MMGHPLPRLFRRLSGGNYRPIEKVPGGPPMPTGTVQPGEAIVIDMPGGQVEVTLTDEGDALVRVCGPRTFPGIPPDDAAPSRKSPQP